MKSFADASVSDLERFAAYRFFRKQCIEMIGGSDVHAISSQITALLTADVEFRTIVESRGISKAAAVSQCGMVHDFIDKGFVAHQALAIRRLTEQFDGPKGRAVVSLPKLISDIESHSSLITRENFVCADGWPYESAEDWRVSKRHLTFDSLSEVPANARTREDLISASTFAKCRARLKSSDKFRSYANKYLAHAADPSTRTGSEEFQISLLDEVYADLIAISNSVSAKILYSSCHVYLPSYAYDALHGIDAPICAKGDIPALRTYWQKRYRELEVLESSARSTLL